MEAPQCEFEQDPATLDELLGQLEHGVLPLALLGGLGQVVLLGDLE